MATQQTGPGQLQQYVMHVTYKKPQFADAAGEPHLSHCIRQGMEADGKARNTANLLRYEHRREGTAMLPAASIQEAAAATNTSLNCFTEQPYNCHVRGPALTTQPQPVLPGVAAACTPPCPHPAHTRTTDSPGCQGCGEQMYRCQQCCCCTKHGLRLWALWPALNTVLS